MANSIEAEATANGYNKSEVTKPASQIDARELAKKNSDQFSLSLQKLISSQWGQQSRSQPPKKENITCYACNRKGHYSNECPEKRSKVPLRTTPPSSPRRGVVVLDVALSSISKEKAPENKDHLHQREDVIIPR